MKEEGRGGGGVDGRGLHRSFWYSTLDTGPRAIHKDVPYPNPRTILIRTRATLEAIQENISFPPSPSPSLLYCSHWQFSCMKSLTLLSFLVFLSAGELCTSIESNRIEFTMRKRSAACRTPAAPATTKLLHSTAGLIHDSSSSQSREKTKGTSATSDGRVSSDQFAAVSALSQLVARK